MNIKEEPTIKLKAMKLVGIDYGKQGNSVEAMEGDLLNFNIIITNEGDTPFFSGIFSEVLPRVFTLQENSISINGNRISPSPSSLRSIPLPSLGSHEALKVRYTVRIETGAAGVIRSGAEISMKSTSGETRVTSTTTSVNVTSLNPKFGVDITSYLNHGEVEGCSGVQAGDILSYKVTISNKGNTNFICGKFTDELSKYIKLLPETFLVNGRVPQVVPYELIDVKIPDLKAGGESIVISFDTFVPELPSEAFLNSAKVKYEIFDGETTIEEKSYPLITFPLGRPSFVLKESATLNTGVPKQSIYAKIGDIIYFTVTIMNTGDVRFTNGGFVNVVPDGLALDQNSITINGRTPEPPIELNHLFMPSMEVDGIIIIKFATRVISKGIYKNYSRCFMEYKYGSTYFESNEVVINVL